MVNTSNKRANELELKQQFLDGAKALSKVPEVFRSPQVTLLICDTVAFRVPAEARFSRWFTATRVGETIGEHTYQNLYGCTRSRTYFRLTWQKVPSGWRWRELRSFAPFEMRPKLANVGSPEKLRHFWPWKMAKPISRGWVRSKLIRALPSSSC